MRTMRSILATLVVASVCVSLACADGDWPRFRGPNGDGKSPDTGLLKQWPAGGPKKLWTAKGCGRGYSSVTLANGLIYTCGGIEGKSCVVAFDLQGQRKWQTPIGSVRDPRYTSKRYDRFQGTRSVPTVDGDALYVSTPVGDVACLDAKSGSIRWSLNMIDKFKGRNTHWAFAESLLVDGDNVICRPGGQGAGAAALNKRTGETVWVCRELSDKPGYDSPFVVEIGGLRQMLTMTHNAAVGIDADTGRLLWRYGHPTKYECNIPTPIYHDGHVLISSGYNQGSVLLKLVVNGKSASVEKVWANRALDNHHGGVVLVDGYLYGSSSRGKWVCLDWQTGEVKWSHRGIGKGSVVYADGMLYCLAENRGTVALVEATPEGYRPHGRFATPGGGKQVWAHPVVCGGRLYIRYLDQLHAYQIGQ